jgi:hypothetical protein
VIWYSRGQIALDALDFWVGTFLIYLLATIQIVVFGWVFGIDRGIAEAEQGAQMRIPLGFSFIMKYVAPAYLLVVFGGFLYQEIIAPYFQEKESTHLARIMQSKEAQFAVGVIALVAVALIIATRVGEKRWRRHGAPTPSTLVDYPVTHPKSND